MEELPKEAKNKILRQLSQIGVAQREVSGRVINFYKKSIFGANLLRSEALKGIIFVILAFFSGMFWALRQ